MDFVESKLQIFNKALDLQAANIDQAFDVKEKDMQQTFADLRIQIESEFKKRSRSNNDFVLERSKIYKMIDEIGRQEQRGRQQTELLGESIGVIVESMVIASQLMVQDEKDREHIALYGGKQKDSGQRRPSVITKNDATTSTLGIAPNSSSNVSGTPVEFEPMCLSCQDDPLEIKRLFKTACLLYKPAPISYKGVQIHRKTLLQLTNELLLTMQSKL